MKNRIVDHIEFNKHKASLAKKGINTLQEFKNYLKVKGWTPTLNYWIKK